MAIYRILNILWNKLRKRKVDFFLQSKYLKIKDYYGKYCLDIGSGTGRFSKFLKRMGHRVRSIDVVDKSEFADLRTTLFDGKFIPFGNKMFDTSILMFVLHHTDNVKDLLKECIRVTKKRIIIGEDVMVCCMDRMLGNIHLGTSPWSRSKNGFNTDEGWQLLFCQNNLKLLETITISRCEYPVYPVERKIYVLEVQ